MIEHRGVTTATMIYDTLAVCDHFLLVDDDAVLGPMDRRDGAPLMFRLRREAGLGSTGHPRCT